MSIFHTPDAKVIIHNYQTIHSLGYGGESIETENNNTDIIDVTSSVLDIQIAKQKSDPIGQSTVTLSPNIDWLSTIVPASWICIYLKTSSINEEEINSTKIIEDCHPLKFLGLILSIRRNQQVSSNGAIITRYTINAVSFGYLLHTNIVVNNMFFSNNQNEALRRIISDFTHYADNLNSISWKASNAVKNTFAFVSSLSKNHMTASVSPLLENVIKEIEAIPKALPKIPNSIKILLGIDTNYFFDSINSVSGIDIRGKNNNQDINYINQVDLLGSKFFYPKEILNGTTVYNILVDYINPVMNELLVDLFPFNGSLLPCIVHRQIPFNSPNYKPSANIEPSFFKDLYNIELTKELIINEDIGVSIHSEMNFIFPTGYDTLHSSMAGSASTFLLNNPPKINFNSINRIGLKSYMPQCSFTNESGSNIHTPRDWSHLLEDWYYNNSRVLNGSVTTVGVDKIISVGDNVSFINKDEGFSNQGFIGHIESINYMFHIDDNGAKTFRITFGLSRIETETHNSITDEKDSEIKQYVKQRVYKNKT
jgi:hypothetical protein